MSVHLFTFQALALVNIFLGFIFCVCVSGGKKCLFFGNFGVLCFLETPVWRFALLPYYRQYLYSDWPLLKQLLLFSHRNLFVSVYLIHNAVLNLRTK